MPAGTRGCRTFLCIAVLQCNPGLHRMCCCRHHLRPDFRVGSCQRIGKKHTSSSCVHSLLVLGITHASSSADSSSNGLQWQIHRRRILVWPCGIASLSSGVRRLGDPEEPSDARNTPKAQSGHAGASRP